MSFQIDFSLSVSLHMLLFNLRKHTEKGYRTGQNILSQEGLKTDLMEVSAKKNNSSFWICKSCIWEGKKKKSEKNRCSGAFLLHVYLFSYIFFSLSQLSNVFFSCVNILKSHPVLFPWQASRKSGPCSGAPLAFLTFAALIFLPSGSLDHHELHPLFRC